MGSLKLRKDTKSAASGKNKDKLYKHLNLSKGQMAAKKLNNTL